MRCYVSVSEPDSENMSWDMMEEKELAGIETKKEYFIQRRRVQDVAGNERKPEWPEHGERTRKQHKIKWIFS